MRICIETSSCQLAPQALFLHTTYVYSYVLFSFLGVACQRVQTDIYLVTKGLFKPLSSTAHAAQPGMGRGGGCESPTLLALVTQHVLASCLMN